MSRVHDCAFQRDQKAAQRLLVVNRTGNDARAGFKTGNYLQRLEFANDESVIHFAQCFVNAGYAIVERRVKSGVDVFA